MAKNISFIQLLYIYEIIKYKHFVLGVGKALIKDYLSQQGYTDEKGR